MAKKNIDKRRNNPNNTLALTDYWLNLSLKTRHIICLVFLFLLPIIMFTDTIIGDQKFMAHDSIQWRAGAESIIEHRENYGEDAIWATHMFAGMPAYLIYYSKAVPHIDTLVFFSFNEILPMMPYFVLLSGSYFFFVLMGLSPLSACIGAVLLGFTTYFPIIIGAGHNTKLYAISWIPWLAIGYWIISRKNIWIIGLFAFALALNLEFRANHPQITYYFAIFFLIWWIYDTWFAYKEKRFPDWVKRSFVLAGAIIIAIICNVQPYWSYMEYSPYSIRGGSELSQDDGLEEDYAMAWSQGRGELLTLIIPGIMGGSSVEGTYWGPKTFTSGPHYFGAIGFLLFILGLVKSAHRIRFLFLGIGVLAIFFALGENFMLLNSLMFDFFPYFNRFRAPETWLVVTIFSFTIVAALGAEWLLKFANEKTQSLKSLYNPLGIVVGLGLIFLLGSNTLLSFEKENEVRQLANQIASQQNVAPTNPQVQQRVSQYIDNELKPDRRDKARSDTMRYLIIVLLGSGLIIFMWQRKIPASYAGIGLLIITAFDLISVGNRYIDDNSKMPKSVERESIIEQQRRPLDTYMEDGVKTEQNYEYRVFPLLDNPFSNAVPGYFYPSLGGYSGAKMSVYQDLINHSFFVGDEGLNLPLLNMLNVKYISYNQPLGLPGYNVAYQGDDGYVLENQNVLPKAFFVDSLVYANSPQEAIDVINTPEFDPSSFAVIETDQNFEISADPNASVEVTHYDARRITMETESETDGFVVLSEIYYPQGWKATLNNEKTEIYKTNYALRGIFVPAGEHQLHLEFAPNSHILGGRISWIGNLFLILIGAFGIGFYYLGKSKER
ncbi:MAG: YfhO family protein [Balneolales bacterium]